ncbi:glycosyl hydrolase [Paenibacillus sp. J22TS3]|uniref:glycosyl hydrolase n=1 Tax=Paenibacillus sp. J22TS3 TaxID=2807192 RepID=UPI001B293272|nr:glycosyl hydrolase [Paenibacillus sp. J22TS3]GIP24351.1 mannan endo-1,4-beta-mannosidase [Paenibacillus sp. J22TS3]
MKRTSVLLFIISLLLAIVPMSASAKSSRIFEAESGTLTGTAAAKDTPGYSGTGYVTSFDNDGDSLAVDVSVPSAGLYQITIRYHSPYGHKQAYLFVNGTAAGSVDFEQTTGFTEMAVTKALLNKGTNTIRLDKGWGMYEIDYFAIEPAAAPAVHQVSKALVNPGASSAVKSLMSYLVDSYGSKILSGQQDYSNVAWIQSNLGKKPAMVGFDLMDYSPSRVELGAATTEIEKAIDWDRQGGIVSFVWHWNAPKDLINQPGKEWWRGFYTDSTTFDIQYALDHPDSEDYALLLRDIDAIAIQLKRLQDANVPVLFRPLHEAEGGWFWWGAKGAEPCKELYRILYDRLTNYHHLNNLIWVWNSISPDWYPGDDVVDIVSYDSYPLAGDYSPQMGKYDQLVSLGRDRKLVAMTENGAIPDPDLLPVYHADWSWFTTWGAFDGNANSLDHLKKVYNHDYVVTLDELPNIKTYDLGVKTAPAAPTGLKAVAGNGQVTLKWSETSGAESYTVKRAAKSAGPYTTIAWNLRTPGFTDKGLENGKHYYYVVTAENRLGASPDSAPVKVKPTKVRGR